MSCPGGALPIDGRLADARLLNPNGSRSFIFEVSRQATSSNAASQLAPRTPARRESSIPGTLYSSTTMCGVPRVIATPHQNPVAHSGRQHRPIAAIGFRQRTFP